jgi:NAD dependent epimerase/dehydratase family enzyme
MPWIHRDDEVGVFLWALDTATATGTFNSCAPNPVMNRDFSRALGRALGRPAIIPTPRLAVAAILGDEMARAATASIRAIPRRATDDGYRFRFSEVGAALRDLLARR